MRLAEWPWLFHDKPKVCPHCGEYLAFGLVYTFDFQVEVFYGCSSCIVSTQLSKADSKSVKLAFDELYFTHANEHS